jgi:FG-GAP-like repeat
MKSTTLVTIAAVIVLCLAFTSLHVGVVAANSGPQFTPPAPVFELPSVVTTTNGPQQVASGDFNNDGKVDLAVTVSGGVDVLIGNGDGTFQPPVTYAVNAHEGGYGIVVADMNNDGIPDLVVTTFSGPTTVVILLGKGDGTFQTGIPSGSLNSGANTLAVGDFNGDGNLDVVVTSENFKSIGILLGNGNGTLQPVFNYAVVGNHQPASVGVGDFNKDGKLDIVVACGGIDLFLGNGDGTFQPATEFVPNQSTQELVVADVNNDGNLDVAFKSPTGVAVLLGQGNGNFGSAINSPSDGASGDLALADMNGDGELDAIIGAEVVMAGHGNGKFAAPKAFYTDGGFSGDFIAVDVNGDGKPDLVEATGAPISSGLAVYLNTGSGALKAPQTFSTNSFNTLLAVADFNNDGKLDAAALNTGNPGVTIPTLNVLLGNGNGTFQTATTGVDVTATQAIAAGDFNNDGNMDVILLSFVGNGNGSIVFYPGTGDGTFGTPASFNAGFESVAMTIGDFNNDGNLDVAVVNSCINSVNCQNGQVSILLGNGNGTFQSPLSFNVGSTPNSIVAADFNNDGNLDIAVANSTGGTKNSGNVSVALGNGNGTFQAATTTTSGADPEGIVAADFNGDGQIDLAVSNVGVNTVSVLPGNGTGGFGTPIKTGGVISSKVMVVADFNGDGKPDLATGAGGGVYVLTGNGNGSFQPPLLVLQNDGTNSISAAVLGSDHEPDLILGTFLQRSVIVITNLSR